MTKHERYLPVAGSKAESDYKLLEEEIMSGTTPGGKAAAEKNKELYGSDFYAKIGARGGSAPHKGRGFQLMPPEKRSAAGKKGGTISKRGSRK